MTDRTPWYGPLARFFGVNPTRTEAESIEERTESELAALIAGKSQTRKFSQDENVRFCRLISDENPVHRNADAARAYTFMKFSDTPLVGLLLVGSAQRVAEETFQSISNYWGFDPGSNFVVGTNTQFRAPAYPGKDLEFSVIGCAETSEGIDLSVRIGLGNETIALTDVSFAGKYRQAPNIAGPLFSESYGLTESAVRAINESLGYHVDKGTSPFIASAYGPSTLLYLLANKNGSMTGGNLRMETSYLGQPVLDDVQVDIMPPKRKTPSNRFNLGVLSSVATTPIAFTSISCVTPTQVTLRKEPRKIDLG